MKKFGIFWGLIFSIPVFAQEIQSTDLTGIAILSPEQPTMFAPESEIVTLPTVHYTWGDFLMGESCQADFNQLQQLPFLSPEQKNLKNKMQAYCLDKVTAWDKLLRLFRQNKKALLVDKTLKKNSFFVGYIKALPYYLFDVHDMRPINADLSSKLDKIQNAIEAKNPQKIVVLMQDLTPDEQLYFMSLFNEASALIDFKEVLSGKEVSD